MIFDALQIQAFKLKLKAIAHCRAKIGLDDDLG